MDPYEKLANAIIIQAARDYRTALRKLRRNPRNHLAQEAQQPGGIQGYLPQGTDFPAGGDCPHPGRAGHWNGFCTSHGSDFLLSVQRGREHHRERRTPWTAHPGKAEGSAGAAP